MFAHRFAAIAFCALAWAQTGHAQLQDPTANDAVRVKISINPDGSRTTYQFDPPNHTAIATVVSAEGKPQGKTSYVLDDAGRYASGEVFAADGKLRFKTRYKYDAAGHLSEETQFAGNNEVQHKIVYSYDKEGKQTGYGIYDGAGKLLGKTTPKISATPQKK